LTLPASGLIMNAGTFNLTGGGTLALGGFTLAVPATGTAALLATENVFTVNQSIVGSADAIQLKVKGNATQTANLQEWQKSNGTIFGSINGEGKLTLNGIITSNVGASISPKITYNGVAYGYYNEIRFAPTGNVSSSNGFVNITFADDVANNITTLRGLWLENRTAADYSGAITDSMSLFLETPLFSGSAPVNQYGIYIRNQSGASSLNYAIYTNAGLNRFGDQLSIVGSADRNQLIVTGFTTQTLPPAYFIDNTAATNVIRNVLQLETQSTGTAAAGLGAGLLFSLETATAATMQTAGVISASWIAFRVVEHFGLHLLRRCFRGNKREAGFEL